MIPLFPSFKRDSDDKSSDGANRSTLPSASTYDMSLALQTSLPETKIVKKIKNKCDKRKKRRKYASESDSNDFSDSSDDSKKSQSVVHLPNGSVLPLSAVTSHKSNDWIVDRRGDQDMLQFGESYRLDVPNYEVWNGKTFTSLQALTKRASKVSGNTRNSTDIDRYRRSERYFSVQQNQVHTKVLRNSLLKQRRTTSRPLSVNVMLPLPPPIPEGEDVQLDDTMRSDAEMLLQTAGKLSQHYSLLVSENPHNVQYWLKLLNAQERIIYQQALAAGNIILPNDITSHAAWNKIIYERQVGILRDAISKNKDYSHICVVFYYVLVVCENGNYDNIERALKEATEKCLYAVTLRRLQYYHQKVNFPTCNATRLRDYHGEVVLSLVRNTDRCVSLHSGNTSPQYLPIRLQNDIDFALVDCFFDFLSTEISFGYMEKALALVQAILDLNLNIHHLTKINFNDVTASLRQVVLTSIVSSYETYWNSEFPRLGERINGNITADGFGLWIQANKPLDGCTYLQRDMMFGREDTATPQELYHFVKETILSFLDIHCDELVAQRIDIIDNETTNALAAANFMEQLLQSHNIVEASLQSADVHYEWVYSRLHGYKIRVPVTHAKEEVDNVDEMIAAEDTGLAYRKILADIKNEDITYMTSEDILKKYAYKEPADPKYENPAHMHWWHKEDMCGFLQCLPLRLTHLSDSKAIDAQPERVVIFDDVKDKLFCVRSCAGMNRLIIRCLKCIGIDLTFVESSLINLLSVDQSSSLFGSSFLDNTILSHCALSVLRPLQQTNELPLAEILYYNYMEQIPTASSKSFLFAALLSQIPYASQIELSPAVISNHIAHILCDTAEESLLSFSLRLLEAAAKSKLISNENAVLARCISLVTYKYSLQKIYAPSANIEDGYSAEYQRLLQNADIDTLSKSAPDMQVWNAFVCAQCAIGNSKMANKVCEKSLMSLGNHVANLYAQNRSAAPAFLALLQATPNGRNYTRSWYGLKYMCTVSGALQLYVTITRHLLHLSMTILPHETVVAEMPQCDAVIALLMQLGNGGYELSEISTSNYLSKSKRSKKQSCGVFPACELENTTILFVKFVQMIMEDLFDHLSTEKNKQKSELSSGATRLLDVGRMSSVFLIDEETKISNNLFSAVYLCAYWFFALSEYVRGNNLCFDMLPMIRCNMIVLVTLFFDIVIETLKSACIQGNYNVPDILDCLKGSLSSYDTPSFHNDMPAPDKTLAFLCQSGFTAKSLIEAEILICIERLHISKCEFLLFVARETHCNASQGAAYALETQRTSLMLLQRGLLYGLGDFPLNRILTKVLLCVEMNVCPLTLRPSICLFPAGGFLRIKKHCNTLKQNYISLSVQYHANVLSLAAEVLRAQHDTIITNSVCSYIHWSSETSKRVRDLIEIMMRDSSCRESPALWQFYLRIEIHHGNRSSARRLLYRSIEHCAWSKESWLSSCSFLSQAFTTKELEDIEVMMRDKGILIRVERSSLS